MLKKKFDNCVQIKVVTWQRESYGLFDYESKSFTQKYYHVDSSCILFQNQKDFELEWCSEQNVKQLGTLAGRTCLGRLNINHQSNQFSFENHHQPNSSDEQPLNPYLVVRSLKTEAGQQRGYSLKVGDVIKLGRLQYQVLQYRDDKSLQGNGTLNTCFEVYHADKKHQGQCKICLGQEQDDQNFIMAPCNCKGSCMHIHLDCLRKWIQNKIHKQSHGLVDEYNFTKFQCEICKTPYPKTVIKGNKEYSMLTIQKPAEPYMILEAVTEKSNYKDIFLVRFSKDNPTIKMGRGHECQIRMTDISVSRVHAKITHKNGKFVLFDNNSKFGTLIKINGRHKLTTERCAIQVGRTVLINVVKPLSALKARKESDQIIFNMQMIQD